MTYHFPSWTGLADRVEEQGGDLRALEGTRADLEVVTDRPLNQGLLVLDNGQKIALSGGDNNDYRGVVQMCIRDRSNSMSDSGTSVPSQSWPSPSPKAANSVVIPSE